MSDTREALREAVQALVEWHKAFPRTFPGSILTDQDAGEKAKAFVKAIVETVERLQPAPVEKQIMLGLPKHLEGQSFAHLGIPDGSMPICEKSDETIKILGWFEPVSGEPLENSSSEGRLSEELYKDATEEARLQTELDEMTRERDRALADLEASDRARNATEEAWRRVEKERDNLLIKHEEIRSHVVDVERRLEEFRDLNSKNSKERDELKARVKHFEIKESGDLNSVWAKESNDWLQDIARAVEKTGSNVAGLSELPERVSRLAEELCKLRTLIFDASVKLGKAGADRIAFDASIDAIIAQKNDFKERWRELDSPCRQAYLSLEGKDPTVPGAAKETPENIQPVIFDMLSMIEKQREEIEQFKKDAENALQNFCRSEANRHLAEGELRDEKYKTERLIRGLREVVAEESVDESRERAIDYLEDLDPRFADFAKALSKKTKASRTQRPGDDDEATPRHADETAGFFLVWRQGSGAGTPTYKHENLMDARKEAERLANATPGFEFVVLEAISAVSLHWSRCDVPPRKAKERGTIYKLEDVEKKIDADYDDIPF